VASAQGGDDDALDRLLHRHYQRLYALCRRLAGDEQDALDACQEALLAVARGLSRFDGRSSFATWAYRVATNACLDELRRKRRRPVPLPTAEIDTGSDLAEEAAVRLDIDAALSRLPPEYRTAVVLRDQAGLSYDDIAQALGVPIGTVRSRIARGRAALVPLLTAGNRGTRFQRPTAAP
jgi:RNA polymerase sigma-70 factor (ECF subfamily)